MASYAECLQQALKAGKISRDAEDILTEFKDTPERGIEMAIEITKANKRNTILESVALSRAVADITSHEKGFATGLMSMLTRDITEKAGYSNIDTAGKAITAQFDAKLAEVYSRFRTRTLGLTQDKEGLGELVRALFGKESADKEINDMALALKEVFEESRIRFNQAGGHINKNEFWNLPTKHNARAVSGGGKMMDGLDEWKETVSPLLDRNKIRSDDGHILNDAELDEALDYVYKTIVTGGAHKVDTFKGTPKLGKKLADRHADRRFLYFKDGDSWMKYNERYGEGDIFTVINDHIEGMAHDIALIERLGPDPRKTFDTLMAKAKTEGAKPKDVAMLEAVYKIVSGHVDGTRVNGVADFFQSTRNVITASTLGGAFLSSVSDIPMSGITSKYNGIPALKVWKRQASLLNPANEADRIFAVQTGLGAEAMTSRASAGNRFSDVYGVGPTAKAAEVVIRGSFLQTWTDAGRKAFGMEFSGLLARNFKTAFDDLDPNLKRAFDTYGIEKADWDKLRKSKPLKHKGAVFADLSKRENAKFQNMVISETDFAVPTPDARVRAMTGGGLDRGTPGGETWRSMMMFKSFPITMITTHLYRAMNQEGLTNKLAYAGVLGMAGMVFGGVALQAKDIARGREPREIDGKFLGAAFAQGGGLGIFGDFMFADHNRFGGGFASTLLGPTAEMADKTIALTMGNAQQFAKGEETNFTGETVKYIERYTPSIWQLNLIKSSIFNQIALAADPRMKKKFNRMVRKRHKDYNQDYWWKPGETIGDVLE